MWDQELAWPPFLPSLASLSSLQCVVITHKNLLFEGWLEASIPFQPLTYVLLPSPSFVVDCVNELYSCLRACPFDRVLLGSVIHNDRMPSFTAT